MGWNFIKYGYEQWQKFFQRTGKVANKEEKHEGNPGKPKTPATPTDDITIGPK